MFDVSIVLLTQLAYLLPSLITLYVIFDLLGSLLFGRK